MNSTGARLRFALAARGWSAARLAREIGVSRQTVHAWIKGGLEKADALRFVKLCDALKIRARWLMFDALPINATISVSDLSPERVENIHENLTPEHLDLWIRVGIALQASNGLDMSTGMDG